MICSNSVITDNTKICSLTGSKCTWSCS